MSRSRSTVTTVEKEDLDYDCTCDANLFYKKYKEQIDRVLGRHFESKFADKISVSKKSKSKTRRGTSSRDDSRSRSRGRYSQGQKLSGFGGRLTGVSDEIGRRTYKGIEAGKRSTTTDRSSEKVSDEMSLRPSKMDIDEFLLALSRKMDECMFEGEEEEERITEQGYYVFERFSEESEIIPTVEKVSTIILSSVEGEGVYPHAPPFEEEYMSETMRRALEYLKKHMIADLFKYLGAQLASNKPCNPIEFLINLLETCLTYRMGYCEPPLLYLPKHIESLFNSMDPMRTGYIDMNQYHTGMFTLGIKVYNMFPEINSKNMVAKHIFLQEAFIRLKYQLDEMIHSDEPSTISAYTARYPSMAGESIVIKKI